MYVRCVIANQAKLAKKAESNAVKMYDLRGKITKVSHLANFKDMQSIDIDWNTQKS